MKDDTDIIALRQPGSVDDPLTEIARNGARRMLPLHCGPKPTPLSSSMPKKFCQMAVSGSSGTVTGRSAAFRLGFGALDVRSPKVRDRAADVPTEKKIRFTSNILPKWARRSKSLDALLPVLYLRGISTGDFQEARWLRSWGRMRRTCRRV